MARRRRVCAFVRDEEQRIVSRGADQMDRAAAQTEAESAGLPIGVLVMARKFRNDVALTLMAVLEKASPDRPNTPTEVASAGR
jgi:hypothetical protein